MDSPIPTESGERPNLRSGQYAVMRAEVMTGKVLRADGGRANACDPVWIVFDSLEAAREFASTNVAAHPEVECNISDYQNHVETIQDERFVERMCAEARGQSEKRRRYWWKRRAGAWQLVVVGCCVLLVQVIHSGDFIWEGSSKAGLGGMVMMSALFGVLCLCMVRCPRQFYVAKTLLTLAVLLGLLCEITVFMSHRPNYGRMRNMCITNLKQIEGAKANWAVDEHKTPNDIPGAADLYGANRYIAQEPNCPEGGTYRIGKVDEAPRCSMAGHSLE